MIDRLEELLGILEEEDEDESERDENVVETGPLSGPGSRRTAPVWEGSDPPAGPERAGSGPGEPAAGIPGTPEIPAAPEAPAVPPGEAEGPVPEKLERAVREADAVRERVSGHQPQAEDGGPEIPSPALPGEDGPAVPPAGGPPGGDGGQGFPRRTGDRSGLELLYRAAARAAEPAAELLSAGQPARRSLPDPVPSEPVRLTVEEMDRAMRRDSRRYDGGMTIY